MAIDEHLNIHAQRRGVPLFVFFLQLGKRLFGCRLMYKFFQLPSNERFYEYWFDGLMEKLAPDWP
jgi:hypothetical protein